MHQDYSRARISSVSLSYVEITPKNVWSEISTVSPVSQRICFSSRTCPGGTCTLVGFSNNPSESFRVSCFD